MEGAIAALIVVLIGIALGFMMLAGFMAALRRFERGQITVYEHETGLKIERGVIVAELGPGRYPTWPAPIEIARIDMREQAFSVYGQEVLTSDRLPVRVTLTLAWRVADAKAYRSAHIDPITRMHELAKIALRERVSQMTLDEASSDAGAIKQGLAEALNTRLQELAVNILSVDARDIVLVGQSKQAYGDLWRAQKEGLAALERARGEQASLRVLANAARMLKGNPELMNLRVLAALQGRPGQPAPGVILGGAPGLVPVTTTSAPDAPEAPSE